jgi:hypothetical protein
VSYTVAPFTDISREDFVEGNVQIFSILITINVPVVFMARYVMVLRGATSLRGALEGMGPENRAISGPKKVEIIEIIGGYES